MDKKYYTIDEAISILIQIDTENQIRKAVSESGIEGTEDMIKRVYTRHPKIKSNMLKTLHKLYKF